MRRSTSFRAATAACGLVLVTMAGWTGVELHPTAPHVTNIEAALGLLDEGPGTLTAGHASAHAGHGSAHAEHTEHASAHPGPTSAHAGEAAGVQVATGRALDDGDDRGSESRAAHAPTEHADHAAAAHGTSDGGHEEGGHHGHHGHDPSECTCIGACQTGGALTPSLAESAPVRATDLDTPRIIPLDVAPVASDPASYLYPLPQGPPPRT